MLFPLDWSHFRNSIVLKVFFFLHVTVAMLCRKSCFQWLFICDDSYLLYISFQRDDLVTDSSLGLKTSRGQSFHFAPLSNYFDFVVSGVTWQSYLAWMWSLSEGCEEIADCPIAVTAYNSVLFFTGPKAPLSTVQLVNECLQQLVIFMHHLYHAAFLLDYLIFISAWFGSSRSQTNTEKLCMLLNVRNTHLRRIHLSFGGWQNENWCDEPQVF